MMLLSTSANQDAFTDEKSCCPSIEKQALQNYFLCNYDYTIFIKIVYKINVNCPGFVY